MPSPTRLPELLSRLTAYCSAQERAPWHIQQKLRQWGTPPALAQEVLQKLKAGGYVDEARFCRVFVRGKHGRLGWGPLKLRAALRALHLPEHLIAAALTTELPPDALNEKRTRLAQRKAQQLPPGLTALQRRVRLARYLQQKGYTATPPDAD